MAGGKGESGGQVRQGHRHQRLEDVRGENRRRYPGVEGRHRPAKARERGWRAEHTAERLEWEAGFAIDYAVASIEQAKLAVLDAIAGRVEAEQARRAV